MKVILNQNVENVGSVGEVVKVSDGFARNFLIPQGLAATATEGNIRVIELKQAKAIVGELKKYDEGLFDKPRWLVLNKLDMVEPDKRAALVKDFGAIVHEPEQDALFTLDALLAMAKKAHSSIC